MNDEQLLAEIREANLTYLMLAQTLIRKDKAEAVFRLGLSEDKIGNEATNTLHANILMASRVSEVL